MEEPHPHDSLNRIIKLSDYIYISLSDYRITMSSRLLGPISVMIKSTFYVCFYGFDKIVFGFFDLFVTTITSGRGGNIH